MSPECSCRSQSIDGISSGLKRFTQPKGAATATESASPSAPRKTTCGSTTSYRRCRVDALPSPTGWRCSLRPLKPVVATGEYGICGFERHAPISLIGNEYPPLLGSMEMTESSTGSSDGLGGIAPDAALALAVSAKHMPPSYLSSTDMSLASVESSAS
eukprot:scaffold2838_cov376-Prasinococcus_capsulatus_cf.AAC.5